MTQALKIVMRSADLPSARAFYEDVLQLEVADEWSEAHGDGCIYNVGEAMIELNEAGQDAGPAGFDLQIKVDDLDLWVERLEGVWDFIGPKHHPWGERTLRMRDPDGLLVTIFDLKD